jgi:hypothetical protein
MPKVFLYIKYKRLDGKEIKDYNSRLCCHDIRNETKSICASLQLKNYDAFEPVNNSSEILKVKTILGCVLDYTGISENDCNQIFALACDYGHIDIVKALVEKMDGDIGGSNFEKAQCSPNRDIPKYLLECKTKHKKLDELFTKYKDVNYYEPKMRFN